MLGKQKVRVENRKKNILIFEVFVEHSNRDIYSLNISVLIWKITVRLGNNRDKQNIVSPALLGIVDH